MWKIIVRIGLGFAIMLLALLLLVNNRLVQRRDALKAEVQALKVLRDRAAYSRRLGGWVRPDVRARIREETPI